MPPDLPLHFGSYRLDGPQGPLWHHAELVALPPKALVVLWQLGAPGRAGGKQSDAARHGRGGRGYGRAGAEARPPY